MPSLRTGVDLIEVPRLERAIERHGARFLRRVYTQRELAVSGKRLPSLAARFAAKEAVAKALCTGIGEVSWKEIEVLHGPAKEPVLHLHGKAKALSDSLGLHTWSVSLSHTQEHAVAMAVALGD
ncbi:MAG: holo-ACP synthase [Anaerolineales bacterium]|nr:holo-ACP synthase [Anaerolineales bacterium]